MTSFAIQQAISRLPSSPSADLSEKYMFLDSKKVVQDMADLGFEVAGFRFPKARTTEGHYSMHEIDFRLPQHIGADAKKVGQEVPRVLFLNSYDGSRKAQLMAGVFRLVCSNGLVAGEAFTKQKFIHMGNYQEDLIKAIRDSAETTKNIFDRIEGYKGIRLDHGVYLELAREGAALRYPENTIDIDPEVILMPRRREDMQTDLWTTFNRIQENLVRGGIPGIDTQGRVKQVSQLNNIEKSNKFNAALWDLTERFALEGE